MPESNKMEEGPYDPIILKNSFSIVRGNTRQGQRPQSLREDEELISKKHKAYWRPKRLTCKLKQLLKARTQLQQSIQLGNSEAKTM